ncbi:MAG TPA: phosphoribosylanthranilate isomerase [Blastocatellia bacterium]|nr:phosphoribosylanthranilate isomerase [Blastocatellia bacterium]
MVSTRVRVKICGVRSFEEAQAAIEAGADALGFNFWPESVRYITEEAAREIIAKVPGVVSCVGVFVNEEPQRIREVAANTGISAAQLHGDETSDICAALRPLRVIKAIRVGADFEPVTMQNYPVSAVLLDTAVKGRYGGTGERFDWRMAIEAKRYAPIILAGGITIENVADAITQVRPLAIDVCSGVEAAPGRKDLDKLRRFMAVVERANAL